jgi:Dolichyl-phosphate-mannose-protein mannosyltransferase
MTKKVIILSSFILAKFLLQYFLISPEYDLQRDEFLHLDQANHLAWGYASVPPFTSWISTLIGFLGNGVFWVKFFPALFGALTMLVVWKIIETLNGNLFALVLGATCMLFSVLLRLNVLWQPNSFDVLSWTAFYFVLIRYIHTGKSVWLFTGALVFALGFLNKYNIGFLAMGLFPAILLTSQRRIFAEKNFYLAVLLGLLLVIPNLLWQYNHDFPVLQHLKELKATQLVNLDRLEFFKDQLLFFSGSLVLIIGALYALPFYPPFKQHRYFFWSFIFTLAVFSYFRAKGYYAIGLYPVYIAFGAVFLSVVLNTGWKKYLRPVLIAFPVLIFIPFYRIAFPNHSPDYIIQHSERYKAMGLLRWEDGKDHPLPQDFADMLGWKELAEKVDSIYAGLPNPAQTLILCDNYGHAGAINYYTKHQQLKAASFDADYINWFKLNQQITDAILVKGAWDEDKERKVEIPLFDTVFLATKRINRFAREPEISIYVLKGAKVDINKRITEEIRTEKMRH